MFFLQGVFCRAFFHQNVPCLKFPCSPTFAIASSYPAQAAMKPRAVLEINVSPKLKFVYLQLLGVCIMCASQHSRVCITCVSHRFLILVCAFCALF